MADPWLDYETIYGEHYYRGDGADPCVDYLFELEAPEETIRQYEWRGILSIVRSLVPVSQDTRWLDYGCGNAGLVRFCSERVGCDIVGFEEGWIRRAVAERGIQLSDAATLEQQAGSFDVVTLIEVLEHAVDPLALLRHVRRMLRPGGLLFLTTGNAAPYRDRLHTWRYVVPEMHVAFFEPDTLSVALSLAGFEPDHRRHLPGSADVIRFKILKSLGLRRRSLLESALPWTAIARLVDRRLGVTAHPVGWAK